MTEFIVAMDFGVADRVRNIWDPYDLKTQDGIRVEVKSAAYVQTWKQKRHSQIVFSVRPTLGWDAQTNQWGSEKKRQSDDYVFCVLANKDQKTIDPLDIDQWEFYVVATPTLDAELGVQKTLGLSALSNLGAKKAPFGQIASVVREVVAEQR